jgi:hypothetical protein
LPSCPSFLKKYVLIVQGSFTLAFQTCKCQALIRSMPHSLLSITLLPQHLTVHSVLCDTAFIDRWEVSIFFISNTARF